MFTRQLTPLRPRRTERTWPTSLHGTNGVRPVSTSSTQMAEHVHVESRQMTCSKAVLQKTGHRLQFCAAMKIETPEPHLSALRGMQGEQVQHSSPRAPSPCARACTAKPRKASIANRPAPTEQCHLRHHQRLWLGFRQALQAAASDRII